MRWLGLALFALVPLLPAQDQELQCKCRKLDGDDYLCKCVAAKGGSPDVISLPSASSSQPSATAAPPASPSAKPTTEAKAESKPATGSLGTPTGETTATGKPIYAGPRGGRYHYSPSGKKVYERRPK